jgi:hypothetical protein
MSIPQARVLNLTPHALHIYRNAQDTDPLVVIPSDGDLRLRSSAVRPSVSHVHPLHYFRVATEPGKEDVEAGIPVIPAQEFDGIDSTCKGFVVFQNLTSADSIIVSMPVAQWLASHGGCVANILSPGTGPTTVVRYGDEEPSRKGQIKGVTALEYHGKVKVKV